MSKMETIQSRLRQKWTYTMRDTMGIMGLNEKIFQGARGARIIVYHGFCPSNPTRFNSLFLTIKTFEQHLQFYKKYFHILSLQDYYARRFSNDKFNICLTFDDGFANNYKYVLPLIGACNYTCTFFVTAIATPGTTFCGMIVLPWHKNLGGNSISKTGLHQEWSPHLCFTCGRAPIRNAARGKFHA
jgi:hypothetical protein